jgi:hypothetical protein
MFIKISEILSIQEIKTSFIFYRHAIYYINNTTKVKIKN